MNWCCNCILRSTLLVILALQTHSTTVPDDLIETYVDEIIKLRNGYKESYVHDTTKHNDEAALVDGGEYDFIVVGSGPAGSAVAKRLSEVPSWQVLLLEAGDEETPYMQVPALAESIVASPYNWKYLTEPQTTWCLGMNGRRCTSPTGKALGGGSVINGMVYTRGNPHDYNTWAELGNDGWSYADVLPYFKKAETCTLKNCDWKYRGNQGPLHVEEPLYVSHITDTFLSAGKEIGYKVLDYNAKLQTGFSTAQSLTKYGKRYSSAQSYLSPARPNLHVRTLTHATQIAIDHQTKTATGVKYTHNKTIHIATAKKEIILSAGPINSAQLLMLSGIGPQEDLSHLGIDLVNNLPVGKRTKDHTAFPGLNFVLNVSKLQEPDLHDQVSTWLQHGNGPLAEIATTGLAFLQTEISKDPFNFPDIELAIMKARFSNSLQIRKEYKNVLEPLSNNETFKIEVRPMRPESTGTLRLASKDPYASPIIDQNQLSDPDGHDMKTMLAGIKKALQLIKTDAFRKLGAYLFYEPIQNCKHLTFGSENYWRCAVRYLTRGARHQTGACRMGPATDEYAVVDEKLRVYGIQNLRVADTSVIPISITGHTHAPANMIGEKAADLIKKEWL